MIQLERITKTYGSGEGYPLLNNISLSIDSGEMVAVMGPSGSGKSTLLYLIGLMDRVFTGDYYILGHNVAEMDEKEISLRRSKMIGFVFQSFNLIREMTALENVMLSLDILNLTLNHSNKISKKEIKARSKAMLSELGLGEHMEKLPGQLSGGQQQRVSIARSLVKNPDIILADEPTGALDQKNGKEIMSILCNQKALGKTIIVVTHDPNVSHFCDRQISILDGTLMES